MSQHGHDRLASVRDGEYQWCNHCGKAVDQDEILTGRNDAAKCPFCKRLMD